MAVLPKESPPTTESHPIPRTQQLLGSALIVSAVGVPSAVLIGNNSLRGEVVTLVAYGVIDPIGLLLFGYAFFYFRAVAKAYAEMTSEVRELRSKLGIPIDDLEPERKAKYVKVSWLNIAISIISLAALVDAYYLYFVTKDQSSQVHNIIQSQEGVLSDTKQKCKATMALCKAVNAKADRCLASNKTTEDSLKSCLTALTAAQHSQ